MQDQSESDSLSPRREQIKSSRGHQNLQHQSPPNFRSKDHSVSLAHNPKLESGFQLTQPPWAAALQRAAIRRRRLRIGPAEDGQRRFRTARATVNQLISAAFSSSSSGSSAESSGDESGGAGRSPARHLLLSTPGMSATRRLQSAAVNFGGWGSPARRIWLVCCCESEPAGGDPPLSAIGLRQASRLARLFAEQGAGAGRTVCAPSRAARQCAVLLAREREPYGDGVGIEPGLADPLRVAADLDSADPAALVGLADSESDFVPCTNPPPPPPWPVSTSERVAMIPALAELPRLVEVAARLAVRAAVEGPGDLVVIAAGSIVAPLAAALASGAGRLRGADRRPPPSGDQVGRTVAVPTAQALLCWARMFQMAPSCSECSPARHALARFCASKTANMSKPRGCSRILTVIQP